MQCSKGIGFFGDYITHSNQFPMLNHLLGMAAGNPSASDYGKIQAHISAIFKKNTQNAS
jgi:hypothetical protein